MSKKTLFIEEIRHGICNTITFSYIFSLSHSSRVKQSILITKSIIITIIIFNIIIIIVGRSDHYDYEDHHLSIMAAPSTRREISDSSQILRFIIVTFLIIIIIVILIKKNHFFSVIASIYKKNPLNTYLKHQRFYKSSLNYGKHKCWTTVQNEYGIHRV